MVTTPPAQICPDTLWRVRATAKILNPPVVAGSWVWVAGRTEVQARDVRDGRLRWRVKTPSAARLSCAGSVVVAWVPPPEGRAWVIDVSGPRERARWSGELLDAAALPGGAVLLTRAGLWHLVSDRWSPLKPSPVWAQGWTQVHALVAGGDTLVVISSRRGGLALVRGQDVVELPLRCLGGVEAVEPVAEGWVLVGKEGTVVRLGRDGVEWARELGFGVQAGVAVGMGYLWAPLRNRSLVRVDLSSGEVAGSWALPGLLACRPVVWQDHLVWAGKDGTVWALSPADRDPVRWARTDRVAGMVARGDLLFVALVRGTVVALRGH